MTTVEQAQALPEVADPFFEYINTTDETGHTVQHRKVRPLSPRGISGDEIIMFRDQDGRLMKVEWMAEGPVKTEFRL